MYSKQEIDLSRILGKQVTLPLLLFVLGILVQDFLPRKSQEPLSKGDVPTVNKTSLDSDSASQGGRWKATKFMRENVVPIEEEEKEKYKPWDQINPYPYKPFKPGEHRLTVGITNIPSSHWILIDKKYKERIDIKWDILKTEYKDVVYHLDPAMITNSSLNRTASIDDNHFEAEIILTEDDIKQANNGLCATYENLVSFLVTRYPQYFQVLVSPNDESAGVFYNGILNEFHPVDPYFYLKVRNSDPQCFRYECFMSDIIPEELSANLDVLRDEIGYIPLISCDKTRRAHELILSMSRLAEEDLILLSPNAAGQFNEEYVLFSGIFAFAAGFNPRNRFLKPLTLIHGPVPEYKRDLKSQMNKFFQRFKSGKLVKRVNYTFQNHDMFYVKRKFTDSRPRSLEELRGGKDLHYRSERQTLMKFDTDDPRGTGTVVFGIRTYLWAFEDEFMVNTFYSQPEILEDLENAIKAMDDTLGHYKGRDEWGPPLLKILEKNKTLKCS